MLIITYQKETKSKSISTLSFSVGATQPILSSKLEKYQSFYSFNIVKGEAAIHDQANSLIFPFYIYYLKLLHGIHGEAEV